MAVLWVGFGGCIGAIARFQVGRWLSVPEGDNSSGFAALSLAGFPLATLCVNVIGSFLIGWLAFLNVNGTPLPDNMRLLLITGLLGGFTTFSTFSLESLQLVLDGSPVRAIINVAANLVLCLLFVTLGAALARAL